MCVYVVRKMYARTLLNLASLQTDGNLESLGNYGAQSGASSIGI